MSTPIQPGALSPEDPKYYAPPKWRNGEVNAPQIQPSMRGAGVPDLQASADWRSPHYNASLADAFPKPREHSNQLEYKGLRIIALTTAVGVVAWTAFCVTVGLGRLDTTAFAQLRNGLPSDPEIAVSERLQAAHTALQRVSRQALAPTLVVADASGDVNAALPLAIKVTNYTPGTTINLSGLVVGTMLSSGSGAGENQWRIAIDDLPNTRVIPPPDYVGLMIAVAELRGDDDQAIVRTPVRLTWRPAAADTTEPMESDPSSASPSAVDNVTPKQVMFEQLLALQNDSTVTQPRPRLKARKHIRTSSLKNYSLAKKRQHRIPLLDTQQADIDPPSELRPSSTYDLYANADPTRGRRSFWNNDFQTIIDRSWERCAKWSDCGRETQR